MAEPLPIEALLPHPGLTITTHRVTAATTQTPEPVTQTLAPSELPLQSSIWPPCECPRCTP